MRGAFWIVNRKEETISTRLFLANKRLVVLGPLFVSSAKRDPKLAHATALTSETTAIKADEIVSERPKRGPKKTASRTRLLLTEASSTFPLYCLLQVFSYRDQSVPFADLFC